jgi:DNA (cytosine-5)-methyltransferase 1
VNAGTLPEREPNGLRLLDPYCRQGAAMGWHLAGFDVTGVAAAPQSSYPFPVLEVDPIPFIRRHGHGFDVIAGASPCHLISPTRAAMDATGRPWVLEYAEDARPDLRGPVLLCGASFGLRTYRHRLFESPLPLWAPAHPWHVRADMGVPRMSRECIPPTYTQYVGRQVAALVGAGVAR